MASLRLRRSLLFSSSLLKYRPFSSIPLSKPHHQHHRPISSPPTLLRSAHVLPPSNSLIQSLSFRSSSLSSSPRHNDADNEKISPDEILFPGCDYNHWLITMDFPKDPKPTPEEMVETYVQTLAKVVGSVEEAKKRMYACSTTTYHGFQAVMTEEMSEKFRGLPGVVFILPDSYIDPVNKEYGGDKYINGTIIPRPPPVQYGRSQGRYGDRNRNYDRPRYDRPRDPTPMQHANTPQGQSSMPMQQGNVPQNQSYMHGDGRNFAPSHNYGPPGQSDGRGYSPPPGRDFAAAGERRDFGQAEWRNTMPGGNRDYAFGGREPMPSYQNYNQGTQGNYINQERRDFSQGERRDHAAPERGDFHGDYRNAGPPGGGDYRNAGPLGSGDYRNAGPLGGGDYRNAGPGGGDYRQVVGSGSAHGQSYTGTGEGQRFSQAEYREGMQEDARDFSPMGQTGTGQGQY